MVAGTTLLAAGAAVLLDHLGMPRDLVLAWLAVMIGYSGARLLLWHRYRRQPSTADTAARRAWMLTLGSGLAGILWGALAWFFFVPQDPLSIALMVAILCGLLSSSTQSIGAYWPAHAAFALPCILPFAARCLMEPTTSLRILGLLSLLYLVFTASFARTIPRTLETQLRLQLRNERLVQQLNAGDDPSRLRGFGLGLAIVQRLADLLGTEVMVRSQLGRGSVFRFQLPVCNAPAPAPEAVRPPQLAAGQCVLVVDDDEQILVAMGLLLESWGVRPLIARSLNEARIELVRSACAPSLVLLDHHLGQGASPQAQVEQLRSWLAPGVPIAIITGDTSSDTMQQVASLDVQVWHKPVEPALLRGQLRHRSPPAE